MKKRFTFHTGTIVLLTLLFAVPVFAFCSGAQPEQAGGGKKKKKDKKGKIEKEPIDDETRKKVDYFYVEASTQQLQGNYREATGLYHQVLELDPNNHAAMYNIGRIDLQIGNNNEAVIFAKKATELDPSNFWYFGLLADAYQAIHKTEKAIETLEEVVQRFPESQDTWLNLSQLLGEAGQYAKSIEVLNKFEAKTGANEEISFRKHQLYLYLDDRVNAQKEIDRLIEIDPYNTQFYQVKYEMHLMYKEEDAAFATLEKILALNPGDGFAQFALADYYKQKGDMERSDKYLYDAFQNPSVELNGKIQILGGLFAFYETDNKVKSRVDRLVAILGKTHPGMAPVLGLNGDLFTQKGQLDSAQIYYKASLQKDPTNEGVWEQLLFIDSEKDEYPVLRKDAESALEYFPDQPVFLYFFGIASMQMKEYDESIYAFEKLTKINTVNPELKIQALSSLGEIYHDKGLHEKSDQKFDEALKLDPGNALILNNYAYYLSLRMDRLDLAETMVLKALKESPNSSAYQDTYGWILFQKGQFEKAAEWIKKAIDTGGGADVIEHYGDVMLKLGQEEKAKQFWQQAIDLGSKIDIDKKLQDLRLK